MPYEIEVYTTNPCPYCLAAKNLLQKRGLQWKEHLVFGGTPEWAAMMKRTSAKTVPQVFVNGELIGGCDITLDLFQKGELQKMVKGATEGARG